MVYDPNWILNIIWESLHLVQPIYKLSFKNFNIKILISPYETKTLHNNNSVKTQHKSISTIGTGKTKSTTCINLKNYDYLELKRSFCQYWVLIDLISCERFEMVRDEETASVKDCGVQINEFCAMWNVECVCACACAWYGRLRDWVFRRRGDCNKYAHSGSSNAVFGHSMCAEWLTVLSGKISLFFGWASVVCFQSAVWSCCDIFSWSLAQ